MINFLRKIYVPLAWTIFIQVLLCLPGNNLPSEGIFQIPQLDKIFHVTFFGLLVGLWCFYFKQQYADHNQRKKIFFLVFLGAAANGIIIEYIQYYFIPLRSFDDADIIADLISSSIVYGVCNVKWL